MFDLELLKVNREGIIRRISGQIEESPAPDVTSSKNLPVSVNMNTCRSGGWLSSCLTFVSGASNHSSLSPVGLILIFAFLLPNTVLSADLGAGFSACEGAGCPASYSAAAACAISGNPTDEAFSVFIGGDLTTTNAAEAEGIVAIGGNFNMDRTSAIYNVGVAGVGSCVTPPI